MPIFFFLKLTFANNQQKTFSKYYLVHIRFSDDFTVYLSGVWAAFIKIPVHKSRYVFSYWQQPTIILLLCSVISSKGLISWGVCVLWAVPVIVSDAPVVHLWVPLATARPVLFVSNDPYGTATKRGISGIC